MPKAKDYLDPKQNPFLPQGTNEDNPGVPMSDEERAKVDLNPEGLAPFWPEDQKAFGLTPPAPPDPFTKAGLDEEKIKSFVEKSGGIAYIYEKTFYDPETSAEVKFQMAPKFVLEKHGDAISVKRGDQDIVLVQDEIDALHAAIDKED